MVSIGAYGEVDGQVVTLPHPDPRDCISAIEGAKKRFCSKPPDVDKAQLRKLKSFVTKWVRDNLKPLDPTLDTSVETWLEGANYTQVRKEELLKTWNDCQDKGGVTRKHTRVKSFIKWEQYEEFKYPRGINSRSDAFKCAVGPIFHHIEKILFQDKHFVKYIPIGDRPKWVMDRLSGVGCRFVETDYSTFETSFIKEVMEAVEMVLYEYMTSSLPGGQAWYQLVHKAMTGKNSCSFRDFLVELSATRMSGEMCTSLGNGFTNLMVMLFLCEENGVMCD